MNVNYYTLALGLLGAVKLILNAYGVELFTDETMNAVANGLAAVMAVVGVYTNHRKAE